MIIKILGANWSRCIKLEDNTKEALRRLKLAAQIIKVTELHDIMAYGTMGSPILVIDEKVVMYGRTPSVEEIMQLINDNK
jgi:small redox-active disulfide protein 2